MAKSNPTQLAAHARAAMHMWHVIVIGTVGVTQAECKASEQLQSHPRLQ